jgi:NTE family protein
MRFSLPGVPALKALSYRHCIALLACIATLVAIRPAMAAESLPTRRPKTCLVLSGGGARGIVHIGVLKVLEQLHVPVDCVVGTSAGAIIGGVYASGASPEEIEAMIRGADWDLLLSDQPVRADRSIYTKEAEREHLLSAELGTRARGVTLPRGLVAGQHLQYFLQQMVSPRHDGLFDHLPIQYRALATDLENGRLVVLEHGDLAAAFRASMSVPGYFAPVEIDGQVLVDGGLVRNIGVDVARALGAQRLIVVNVGTPLMKRAEIESLVNSADQMLRILTNQNVDASLATLTPDDVLIEPDLGTLSSSDFAHAQQWIPAAETATRRNTKALSALALNDADYALWQRLQRVARSESAPNRIEVDASGLSRLPAAMINATIGPQPTDVNKTVGRLLATDDFETVKGYVKNDAQGTTLVLQPVEKPWGPDYLRAGAQLTTDFTGESSFLVTVDHRTTWLNHYGMEWRNRASFGHINSLRSQLRIPLDTARSWYVAPELESTGRLRDVFTRGADTAQYRIRQDAASLLVGRSIGVIGELMMGIEHSYETARLAVGAPVIPQQNMAVGLLRAQITFDRLDSLDFPTHGYFFNSNLRVANAAFGGQAQFRRWSSEYATAFGGHNASILLTARYETSMKTTLPLAQAFALGGFQNISGLVDEQVLADEVAFIRAVYRTHFLHGNLLLPDLYAGVSLEASDVHHLYDLNAPRHLFGGSVFLSAQSAFGPLYLGAGTASNGHGALYLYVGRPWP